MSELCHTNHNCVVLVLLAVELAKFMKRISREKGWWHRLPLSNNMCSYEKHSIISSAEKMLAFREATLRVTLKAICLCKSHVSMKGSEEFKGRNELENQNL